MAFDGDLGVAAALVLQQAAEALAPAPEMKISEWVDLGLVNLTAKTNTPREGPWDFEGVEYLRDPLDRLHPDDPCSRVTIRGGAQTGKSSVGQLWVCWSVANHPKSFAIGLPTAGEVGKYNDYKLQPLLDDSPELAPKVRPASTKGTQGSSVRKKKLYTGASLLLFNLSSPAELQMISTGNMILEEVANTLKEVGTRGNPIKQARERAAAYSVVGSKELMVSTAGEAGECEVTKAEEEGDRRRFYGKCVHCGGHFRFEPEGFKVDVDGQPPHFDCPGCGGQVEDQHRAHWRKGGHWVPTFPSDDPANPEPPAFIPAKEIPRWKARPTEGREPSYYVWQAMCGLIALAHPAKSVRDAKTPEDLKTLDQQTYGRAHDRAVDAVGWEELHKLREDYATQVVPTGADLLTGFCDVGGGYLQWAVYGWGPGAEWWVVDRGVISGDTAGDEVWLQLDEVVRRTYPHADGGELGIAAFGVDTGFRTQKVYAFVRGRSQSCYAMDGRPGWKVPILGKPSVVKVIQDGRVKGRVKLWPTGTWELKSLLAWSLKLSIEGGYRVRLQGRGHWSRAEDEAWAQEMTSEVLREDKNVKTLQVERWWAKIRKNEELDCWVGARALAWSLGVGAPRRDRTPGDNLDWAELRARRGAAGPQTDLFDANRVRTEPAKTEPPPAADAPSAKPRRRFYRSKT